MGEDGRDNSASRRARERERLTYEVADVLQHRHHQVPGGARGNSAVRWRHIRALCPSHHHIASTAKSAQHSLDRERDMDIGVDHGSLCCFQRLSSVSYTRVG